MNNPLVSVLMTAYNRELYIAEAIESVLVQDYSNFELIVVDDSSSDKTLEIAQSYQSKDSRIIVYKNEKNLGDYSNRNKAASYAIGKYLKYLDADDVIYPHGLSVMVNAMEKYPQAAIGIQSPAVQMDKPYPILMLPEIAFQTHYFKGGLFMSGPSGVIIRRDIFQEIGGFTGKRFIGDTELWLQIGLLHPIVGFQPSLIWWREHDTQEIKIERKTFDPVLQRFFLDKHIIAHSAFPLNQGIQKLLLKKTNRRFLVNLFRYIKKSKKIKLGIQYYKSSEISLFDFFKAIF
jgi:glycosyltransferase involved in cell wall biosynthesis